MSALKTEIERDGQHYVDEPVMREVSKADQIALEVANACGRPIPSRIEEIDHYERVRLRWMRPDGKGGLAPR